MSSFSHNERGSISGFVGGRGGVTGSGDLSIAIRTRRVDSSGVGTVRGGGSIDGAAANRTVIWADAAAGPVYRAVCTLLGA
jgi:hypothetical protein